MMAIQCTSFFIVEKVLEADHSEKRAPESRDGEMGGGKKARVAIRVSGGHDQRREGIDPRDDRDDNEREDNPHAEDRDGDSPRNEAPPPDGRHLLQHGRVHDGVVERQRDFENREHRDDKHRRKGADQAASGLPAEQSPESEPGEGHQERVAKVADRGDHYPSRLAQSRAAVQSRPIATGAGGCFVGSFGAVVAKSDFVASRFFKNRHAQFKERGIYHERLDASLRQHLCYGGILKESSRSSV